MGIVTLALSAATFPPPEPDGGPPVSGFGPAGDDDCAACSAAIRSLILDMVLLRALLSRRAVLADLSWFCFMSLRDRRRSMQTLLQLEDKTELQISCCVLRPPSLKVD